MHNLLIAAPAAYALAHFRVRGAGGVLLVIYAISMIVSPPPIDADAVH